MVDHQTVIVHCVMSGVVLFTWTEHAVISVLFGKQSLSLQMKELFFHRTAFSPLSLIGILLNISDCRVFGGTVQQKRSLMRLSHVDSC